MSVSFQNNFSQSLINTTSYRQDTQTAAQKMQAVKSDASKNMRMAEITQGTEPYKDENDRLLRKMHFSQTKAEAMGEFYGSMQTALRESGSRGIMAAKRVGNMMDTNEAFKESAVYRNKKDKDTFLSDQIEAMEKKQQEMKELEDAVEKKREDDADEKKTVSEASRSESEENALRSSSNKITNTTGTSSTANADAQRNAAKQYKVNDNPKRNMINDIFTGMI